MFKDPLVRFIALVLIGGTGGVLNDASKFRRQKNEWEAKPDGRPKPTFDPWCSFFDGARFAAMGAGAGIATWK